MPRRTYDLTNVRIFPEPPEPQWRDLWNTIVLQVLDRNPQLSGALLGAVAFRRIQERLDRPDQ